MHRESLEQPENFWRREARALSWVRPPERCFEGDFSAGDVSWFADGQLNVTLSCVDRHAASEPERPAVLWLRAEGDVETLSYRALRQHMCRMANVLLSYGVRPQDRVAVYLPLGTPLLVTLLACARVGAVHLAVPASVEPVWLRRALRLARARLLVTANEAELGAERIPLWERADEALHGLGRVEAVLVQRRTEARVPLAYARDHELDRALGLARPTCAPALLQGEDSLLLVAAAGDDSVRPVVHGSAGFLLQALLAQREALGVGPTSRILCSSEAEGPRTDVLLGALALGATLVLDERGDGAQRLDALGVTHVLGRGESLPRGPGDALARTSVCLDGSEGSRAQLRAVWSSEGGGMLTAHFAGAGATPLFGVDPVLLDARGAPVSAGAEGELCTRASWPAQPRTFESDHARFVEQRLRRFPGLYRTGERCRLLADGGLAWVGRMREPTLVALSSAEERSAPGPIGRA